MSDHLIANLSVFLVVQFMGIGIIPILATNDVLIG